MKRILTVVLAAILIALLWQLYQLYLQNRRLKDEFATIDSKLRLLAKENSELQSDLEYFSESDNLAKELRSRFNYKQPGEKLIIVVPPKEEGNR